MCFVAEYAFNALINKKKKLESFVFCLFGSKLSLYKGQIIIIIFFLISMRQAGFMQGESRENIFC